MELKKLLPKYLALLAQLSEVETELSQKGVDPSKIRLAYQEGGEYAVTEAGSTAFRYSHGAVKEAIAQWIDQKPDGYVFRNKEVKYQLDISSSSVSVALNMLVKRGILKKVAKGKYEIVERV